MAAKNKLKLLAKEKGTTERALLIWALDTSQNYTEAAEKLGISMSGVRAAVRRHKIATARRTVLL